jgi:hypothetical protein
MQRVVALERKKERNIIHPLRIGRRDGLQAERADRQQDTNGPFQDATQSTATMPYQGNLLCPIKLRLNLTVKRRVRSHTHPVCHGFNNWQSEITVFDRLFPVVPKSVIPTKTEAFSAQDYGGISFHVYIITISSVFSAMANTESSPFFRAAKCSFTAPL